MSHRSSDEAVVRDWCESVTVEWSGPGKYGGSTGSLNGIRLVSVHYALTRSSEGMYEVESDKLGVRLKQSRWPDRASAQAAAEGLVRRWLLRLLLGEQSRTSDAAAGLGDIP